MGYKNKTTLIVVLGEQIAVVEMVVVIMVVVMMVVFIIMVVVLVVIGVAVVVVVVIEDVCGFHGDRCCNYGGVRNGGHGGGCGHDITIFLRYATQQCFMSHIVLYFEAIDNSFFRITPDTNAYQIPSLSFRLSLNGSFETMLLKFTIFYPIHFPDTF